MISQAIQFNARLRPQAPAVHLQGKDISYAVFWADIDRMSRALQAQALAPRSRVAVLLNHPYMHWTALMACARLGFATVSCAPADLASVGATACLADEIIPGAPAHVRSIIVTRDWLGQASNELPPCVEPVIAGTDLARVVLSSGTTGTPKRIGITFDQLRSRTLYAQESFRLHSDGRYLSGVGVATVGGYVVPVASMYAGGAMVIAGADPARALAQGKPTSTFISPAMLGQLVDSLPADAVPDPGLLVVVGGAVLPPTLNHQTRMKLTPALYILYGSTEVSTTTLIHAGQALKDPGCVGYTVPYASIEVVDDAGHSVPTGAEGLVRMRGAGMADGYLEDDEVTSSAYRDGWFYPGDVGRFNADGTLSIVGRVTELINLGGIKVAPHLIDEAMASAPGVADLAAFGVRRGGTDQVWIAVAGTPAFDEKAFVARYLERFPSHPVPAIARMPKIPRNQMGKAERAHLRDLTLRQLQRTTADGKMIAPGNSASNPS